MGYERTHPRHRDQCRQRTFLANAAHNIALKGALWAKVAQAALGGNKKSRERHTSRGKLLPRERVERLLDPGSPFLEIGQLAANDLYHGEVPGAGLIVDKCPVPAKGLGAESGDIGVLGRHAEMKIWTLALPKNARK